MPGTFGDTVQVKRASEARRHGRDPRRCERAGAGRPKGLPAICVGRSPRRAASAGMQRVLPGRTTVSAESADMKVTGLAERNPYEGRAAGVADALLCRRKEMLAVQGGRA